MEKTTVKAQSKYLRQSPYKMRLVLNLIRGLDVQDASVRCRGLSGSAAAGLRCGPTANYVEQSLA